MADEPSTRAAEWVATIRDTNGLTPTRRPQRRRKWTPGPHLERLTTDRNDRRTNPND